ncbi:ImmA/IrrE family metallo-endopeptidase [Gordonia pseudamarae]|jgi:Zn-dependent peptidase ImmA (M78 family)/transcriptional regulator with XRE-family HTH domain|uniref:ImmA/IrrE family metallo-endopeptidase n=1 Tax=Gordonia pseudamarae TaxID=2831662 RepID=A0ABX6ILR2_9ACTN|nr:MULTISPECIES: XRE family transcriptional regulator [Gordonia]MBD0022679.1 ImmA/IrrE family metallo-endopeptidase [Gordonia sp. (in: high G+C Gram-positive bacteria)]QHN27294.1 ImmA/IrrE family metallo-endopeptidase [Gordonia pseudamarae]QHN36178.1 ImmA/IrrE family metallo-endopeptidase [Gordonia pseudamarae]
MDAMVELGQRVRSRMPAGMSQNRLAERVGMTPDALSRALNGRRGLSLTEVTSIAEVLGADTHWLITGADDPFAVSVAARHSWDARSRVRVNNGRADDQVVLDQVVALYRAAYPPHGPGASVELPADPSTLRDLLGPSFTRTFADVTEQNLGVDVIRIPGLKTDYSVRIGGRGVIVLATRSSWFRSNWSLAHELGHLALGHHSSYGPSRRDQPDEQAADKFAAALLLPAAVADEFTTLTSEADAARVVWDLGVSTEAVRNRLRSTGSQLTEVVAAALEKTTPRLLQDNRAAIGLATEPDPIVVREQQSSARRVPLTLLSALQHQVDRGSASPELLAWALDVPVDDIDFPEPDDDAAADAYAVMLTDRPTVADLRAMVTGAAG